MTKTNEKRIEKLNSKIKEISFEKMPGWEVVVMTIKKQIAEILRLK